MLNPQLSKAEAEPKPEPKPEPEAEPKAKPEPKAEPEPEAEPVLCIPTQMLHTPLKPTHAKYIENM